MKLFILTGTAWLVDMAVLSQAGPVGRAPVLFALCYIMGFALMALMARTCPRQWSLKQVAAAAFLLGLLGRGFFVWYFPVGNDAYRYIWEGYIQTRGFNPYDLAPDNPLLAHLIRGDMAAIWQGVNHKDLSAVYPPLVMLLFRGLAMISPSTLMIKAAMLGFDLVILAVLMRFIQRLRIPPAHLFWYALNPLVLVYGAGEAHLDMVQAAFLLMALYAVYRHKPVIGFLSMGAAAVSKYFAFAALPFVMKRSNRYAWPAAAAAGIFFLPFAHAPKALFQSLHVFGSQMHYNDGIADVLRFFTGGAALPVLAILLPGTLAAIYLFEHEILRSVYLAMGAILLCLPTLHPWYLLLMAPFMVIYPSRAWLVLMLATVATLPVLAHEYNTGVFQEIKWLKWIEYLPFAMLLVYDTSMRRSLTPGKTFARPRSVSVVMPVLNEADRIQAAIQSAQADPEVVQVIVVDGGSHDATPALARESGAVVLAGPRGRGCQVNAGIGRASGDVILILHADTVLRPGAVRRMLRSLAAVPSIPGGAFEMAFSEQSLKLQWIAAMNNCRARFFGIAFGDQGQFVRRAALEGIGGFPDMKLMEDVELSMRLKRFGRPLFVKDGVCVSPRRWMGADFTGNVWKVIALFFRYLLERRFNGPDNIRIDYYGKYYGRQ